jgi:cell fate (sporulation/competence/biofilm development) regulator YlbF (YheA/YmcA/DUF963 family)
LVVGKRCHRLSGKVNKALTRQSKDLPAIWVLILGANCVVLRGADNRKQKAHRRRQPKIMPTQLETNLVTQKTRELCQTILDQPDVQSMRKRMDAFMADEKARNHYESLLSKSQVLQQKQQSGVPLGQAEISDFEKLREGFLNNPVGRGFLDAQEDMHKMQESVTQYVAKTFELGRVPEESDMESDGSCGHGCGCHH